VVDGKEIERRKAETMSVIIRPESTADHEAIWHVNRLAFSQDEEATRAGTVPALTLAPMAVLPELQNGEAAILG
jgi:predicted N-acetyltransferase YhbS